MRKAGFAAVARLFTALATLTLIATLPELAQAQNTAPSQRVVAGCVGYASEIANDLSGAPRNSGPWESVFRPAREECLARGGPELMPNGSAFSPYYMPHVAARSSGAAQAYVSNRLPPGKSFQQAVADGLQLCDQFALSRASAAGPANSTAWTNAGRSAARICPDQTNLTPPVKAALKSAIARSMACVYQDPSDPLGVCVDGNGDWWVCERGFANCMAGDAPVYVNGTVSDDTNRFFSCAGGSCLHAVVNENPRGNPNPTPRPSAEDVLKRNIAQSCGSAGTSLGRWFCALDACIQSSPSVVSMDPIARGQFCAKLADEIVGQTFEQALAAFANEFSMGQRLRENFEIMQNDPHLKKVVAEPYRQMWKEMMSGPGAKEWGGEIAKWQKNTAISSATSFLQDLFMGIALLNYRLNNPCQSGILRPDSLACVGGTTLTAGATAPTMDFTTGCRLVYERYNGIKALGLPPNLERNLRDAVTADCIARAPQPPALRQAVNALVLKCAGSGSNMADLVGWSRNAVACFNRLANIPAGEDTWFFREHFRIGADSLSNWVKACSRDAGANWRGTTSSGWAELPPGATDGRAMVQRVRQCLDRISSVF